MASLSSASIVIDTVSPMTGIAIEFPKSLRFNAEQVTKIAGILKELGLEIATPADARAILALKGKDQVNI